MFKKTKKPSRPLKIIFLGTPDFSLPTLTFLANNSNFKIELVITQPDKKIGRDQILTAPPVKKLALSLGLPIYQPLKIKTEITKIKEIQPDLIIVAAYGQIIPPDILAAPTYDCINIHGSLLPKYRGAACLQAPILNGDRQTGITIMKMDAGLDTGPILAQRKIKLTAEETVDSLHDKMADLGAKLLIPVLNKYVAGRLKPRPQNDRRASYVKVIKKEDGHLDFTKSALEISRAVRALNPWPGTFGYLSDPDLKINRVLFKILAVRPRILVTKKFLPGEIFTYNNALAIKCGHDALIISKLQLEGRKVMEVDDFLRGNQVIIGCILK